jgi:hypothetical protein
MNKKVKVKEKKFFAFLLFKYNQKIRNCVLEYKLIYLGCLNRNDKRLLILDPGIQNSYKKN